LQDPTALSFSGDAIAHRSGIPHSTARRLYTPHVQFARDLAKGCATRRDLANDRQDVRRMLIGLPGVALCPLAGRVVLLPGPSRHGPAQGHTTGLSRCQRRAGAI